MGASIHENDCYQRIIKCMQSVHRYMRFVHFVVSQYNHHHPNSLDSIVNSTIPSHYITSMVVYLHEKASTPYAKYCTSLAILGIVGDEAKAVAPNGFKFNSIMKYLNSEGCLNVVMMVLWLFYGIWVQIYKRNQSHYSIINLFIYRSIFWRCCGKSSIKVYCRTNKKINYYI